MTRSIDCDNKLAGISTSPISGYTAGCTLGPPGGRMSCEQKRCIISRSEFGVFLSIYLCIFGCTGASLPWRAFSLVAVQGLLIVVASLAAEHAL